MGLQSTTSHEPEFATACFDLDFTGLLRHPLLTNPEEYIGDGGCTDADVSLVSGRVITHSQPQVANAAGETSPLAVANRGEWSLIAQESAAFERLKAREYQGLDMDMPPCNELQTGLAGVARGYTTEPDAAPDAAADTDP